MSSNAPFAQKVCSSEGERWARARNGDAFSPETLHQAAVRGENMAGHRKPPAAGVRSAGGPIPGQYPLNADFCELSPPPTSGRRREDPVMCDQQVTSASLPDRSDRGSLCHWPLSAVLGYGPMDGQPAVYSYIAALEVNVLICHVPRV